MKLLDSYFTNGKTVRTDIKEEEVYLNLVMNYIPETLYSLQKKLTKRKECLPEQQSNPLTK